MIHERPNSSELSQVHSLRRILDILCGGYWKDVDTGGWIQAGDLVRKLLHNNKVLQRQLGWSPPVEQTLGSIAPVARKKDRPTRWDQTQASRHYTPHTKFPRLDDASAWFGGQSLTTVCGDIVRIGAWVVADGTNGKPVFGRILELLHRPSQLVILEQFVICQKAHPDFLWPILSRPAGAEIVTGCASFVVLTAKAVKFVVSVQHDCQKGDCKPALLGMERQEREETHRTRSLIQHSDDDFFVLNLAAFHNSGALSRILPKSFTKPQPMHEDRKKFHHNVAAEAQILRASKRKKTAEKRRATLAAKKERAQQMLNDANAVEGEEEDKESGSKSEVEGDNALELEGEGIEPGILGEKRVARPGEGSSRSRKCQCLQCEANAWLLPWHAHESTISYRFPSSFGSPSPPPIVPSSPDLAHQNEPGPSNPYLALPPPEDEIPDLDELPSEQPPSPPPTTPARTMSGHHRITLAADPPYFDGDKSKYLGFVDSCTTYIGAYRSEFSQDETKILFVLSYLRNESGTSCAASRWAMNWKQHNFDGFQGLKAGTTAKTFLEELQRAFGDSNAEQVAAARLMALHQNKRSFADYISDFEMLASDAGYNVVDTTDDKGEYKKGDQDNILIKFLERGLSSEIASRLYNTGVPLPKAYGAFKAWCINIEANALRDQLRKASYRHPTPRPPPPFRPQVAPMTPAPAPARPAANEPVPMEIDRTHARGRNIICYNCQQPGHIARNCPEPRKKRTFFNRATMLEEIENGDKDNEFLKEIAEKLREKGF
ncbi:unnamed protein product [Mycena citricolor]|uniref:CCHC-type domain-containing protein n=1 Tax=Mycena citricolor TaxID=2018698 RepID=A0AAD2H7D4_9AGAR|nr:unnamed protein product [Mycena citricolor]